MPGTVRSRARGDLRGQGLAVRQGAERVFGAVDDERGRGDLRQRREPVGRTDALPGRG